MKGYLVFTSFEGGALRNNKSMAPGMTMASNAAQFAEFIERHHGDAGLVALRVTDWRTILRECASIEGGESSPIVAHLAAHAMAMVPEMYRHEGIDLFTSAPEEWPLLAPGEMLGALVAEGERYARHPKAPAGRGRQEWVRRYFTARWWATREIVQMYEGTPDVIEASEPGRVLLELMTDIGHQAPPFFARASKALLILADLDDAGVQIQNKAFGGHGVAH